MARGPMSQVVAARRPGVASFGGRSAVHDVKVKTSKDKALSSHLVLAAVESLYLDEIHPHSRILKRRLAERDANGTLRTIHIDSNVLRGAVAEHPLLEVRTIDGGDWFVTIRNRTATFVDPHDPCDVYMPELWAIFSAYLSMQRRPCDYKLPSSRYACAQELQRRAIPFFCGLTLGRLCHIVQLSISQKSLLGYLDGSLVPFCMSRCSIKRQHAEHMMACGGKDSVGDLPRADWFVARSCLSEIMEAARRSEDGVERLANIKRIFRSRYQLDLSETMLGYTKLSELLQDSRFADICSVELRNGCYAVVPCNIGTGDSQLHAVPPSERFGGMQLQLSLSEMLRQPMEAVVMGEGTSIEVAQPKDWQLSPTTLALQLSPSALLKSGSVTRVHAGGKEKNALVKNTFIDQPVTPLFTPAVGARIRARSLPKDMGSRKSDWETACHVLSYQNRPVMSRGTRTVTVVKDGSELGMSVSCDGGGLRVENVGPGPVHYWNSLNPELEVRTGDVILEVNGVTGDAKELLEAVRCHQTLVLSVRTPEQNFCEMSLANPLAEVPVKIGESSLCSPLPQFAEQIPCRLCSPPAEFSVQTPCFDMALPLKVPSPVPDFAMQTPCFDTAPVCSFSLPLGQRQGLQLVLANYL